MTLRQDFVPLGLRATGLAGRRGGRLLFADLDFSVPPGHALLLRGPNGAGKTTLLTMLYGVLRPAAGKVVFEGADPDDPPPMHLLAHLPAIRPRLSVAETLGFWAAVNGGVQPLAPALARVGLDRLAGLDAGYLSAGQAKRLALARLLVSPRPVWLLDEPTAALDAEGDRLVGRLIDEHLDAGGTVVAATHLPLALHDPGRTKELRLEARP